MWLRLLFTSMLIIKSHKRKEGMGTNFYSRYKNKEADPDEIGKYGVIKLILS